MDKNKGNGYEALVLCTQLGLTLATPIVLGALVGHWIDDKLGTNMIFLILFLILGIAGGAVSAYRQVMTITKGKSKTRIK